MDFGPPRRKIWFDYRFITTAEKMESLADFYGSEDFMQIFCVFSVMLHTSIGRAKFDDEGVTHSYGIGGRSHQASMVFEDEEGDTTGDGEADAVVYFHKHETFQDFPRGFRCP